MLSPYSDDSTVVSGRLDAGNHRTQPRQPTPELIVSEFGQIRVDLKSKVCTMFDCQIGYYQKLMR